MSKLKVFCIHDSKACAYNQPFMTHLPGQAIRMFQDGINDPSSVLAKHSADFTLFQVAEFDDSTGVYENVTPHINLGNAVQFKNVQ